MYRFICLHLEESGMSFPIYALLCAVRLPKVYYLSLAVMCTLELSKCNSSSFQGHVKKSCQQSGCVVAGSTVLLGGVSYRASAEPLLNRRVGHRRHTALCAQHCAGPGRWALGHPSGDCLWAALGAASPAAPWLCLLLPSGSPQLAMSAAC